MITNTVHRINNIKFLNRVSVYPCVTFTYVYILTERPLPPQMQSTPHIYRVIRKSLCT